MSIEVGVERRAGVTVVAVTGDIDLLTAPELESALAVIDGPVVIDLTHTGFIDSTALGVFVGADQRQRPTGQALTLVCPSPRLQKIFRITRLDEIWTIHDDLDQALPATRTGSRRGRPRSGS